MSKRHSGTRGYFSAGVVATVLSGSSLALAQPSLTTYDENLVYFEYARKASIRCEEVGYPSARHIYDAWFRTKASDFHATSQAFSSTVEMMGARPEDVPGVVELARLRRERLVDQLIADRGVPCKDLDRWLVQIGSLMQEAN